jgi:hypothetical protein
MKTYRRHILDTQLVFAPASQLCKGWVNFATMISKQFG